MTFNLLWIILNFNFWHNFRAMNATSARQPFLKANRYFADLNEADLPLFLVACSDFISTAEILI
jgi:hypothetical protein